MDIKESFYTQVSDPAQIASFQQQEVGSLYAHIAAVLLRLRRPGDGLAMLERGHTIGLARLAEQNGLPLTTLLGKDAPSWQSAYHQVNSITQQVHKMTARLDSARAVKDTDNEKILSQQLDALREQERLAEVIRERLLTRLLHNHPDFQYLFFGQKMTYSALKTALLAFPFTADTLFLEFGIVDDKRTLLFAFSHKDGVLPLILPIGWKTINSKVETWRDSILYRLPDEPKLAQEFYKMLLHTLEQKGFLQRGRYRSLVIVADGPLLDIPFAALRDKQGKRLVEHYGLSTPFSLSMLTWPTPQRAVPRNLLAIANPLGPIPALPRAEEQARQMLALFRPAELLAGPQPTKAVVLHRIGRYRTLHFGVHGEANSQNGLYSRLLLAGTTEAEQELTAAEITEHPLAAQLAVLSACETMQGQKSGGEGLLGLAWAFRAAGCPSVVASQWKVDEAATASLMRRFYWQLRRGARKDAALQKAMLEVMIEPGHEAPYFWAAFQVMGKTDPLHLIRITRVSQDAMSARSRYATVKIDKGNDR